MQLLHLLASVALALAPVQGSAIADKSSITDQASKPFTLVIHGDKSQLKDLNHLPIDGSFTPKGKKSQLLAATGTAHPSGTEFKLSKGSLHWKVYKKSYSTGSIFYGEPIVGVRGKKGVNEYLAVNATSGYLSFKPEPMGSDQYDFRLCHLHSSPGTYKYAVALGDVEGHKCYDVLLKVVY